MSRNTYLTILRSGRGNVFLESAVPLTKSLHRAIVSLGKRLEAAAVVEEEQTTGLLPKRDVRDAARQHMALISIVDEIKSLLARIDREIPLIQLAITASGESMSNSMPAGISPSRLMQASTFLSIGDTQFASDPTRPVQIGPSFTVSCYMLFLGHSEAKGRKAGDNTPKTPNGVNGTAHQQPKEQAYGLGEGQRKPIWQEVMHKARVRLCRTPMGWGFDRKTGYCENTVTDLDTASRTAFGRTDEFSYHLEIIEDFDDGRLHDEDGTDALLYDNILAGIRESIPVHQISKIFYTDTGKILNIGNAAEGENNPVLLLKRDAKAATPGELRREWGREDSDKEDETKTDTPVIQQEMDGLSESDYDDEQAAMDRQLRLESEALESPPKDRRPNERRWQFPKHVDQEWIALEVYTENEDLDSDGDDGSEEDDADSVTGSNGQLAVMKPRLKRDRSSVDSNLLAQIRNISLRSDPAPPSPSQHVVKSPPSDLEKKTTATTVTESPESFVARSPFGAITSSLSLMEILIRLTSMQEFQQTSHLAIPDHILTFFLEETSTTGLHGEQRWKVRSEAKRRVGFDPYSDTATK